MTQKNNSIINSLKRLERLGDENSRLTQKARKAANEVEKMIVDIMPLNVSLPEDYRLVSHNDGYYLCYEIDDEDGGDVNYWIGSCCYPAIKIYDGSRNTILKFSKDLANGLLEKFADFMEKRNAETENASTVIEKAKL